MLTFLLICAFMTSQKLKCTAYFGHLIHNYQHASDEASFKYRTEVADFANQMYCSVANKFYISLSHIIMAIWITPHYTVIEVIGLTSTKYAMPEGHYPNTQIFCHLYGHSFHSIESVADQFVASLRIGRENRLFNI